MSSTPAWEPRVGDAFGLALLDYLEHGSEARSQFIERDDGLLETIDTGVLFTQESDWSEVAAPGAEIIGTCIDPFATEDPLHLAYHERNRNRGRHPGQIEQ